MPWFATALPYIAMGLSAAGSVYAGVQQQQAAEEQADILEYNAQVAKEDAAAEREAARIEAEQVERQARITKGQQLLYYGASGFTNAGTPLSIMADTASQYQQDISLVLSGGDRSASRSMSQSMIYGQSASAQRRSGQSALYSGMLNGLSSGMGSYTKYKGIK
jgi:hypothetical protein